MIVSTRVTQESPHRYTSWKSSDEEKRKLRCSLASKDRGLKRQKEKVRDFEKELKQSKQDIKNRDDKINELETDLENMTKQRDRYRSMLFKGITKGEQAKTTNKHNTKSVKKRKRGAQKGHRYHGYEKKKPHKQKEYF